MSGFVPVWVVLNHGEVVDRVLSYMLVPLAFDDDPGWGVVTWVHFVLVHFQDSPVGSFNFVCLFFHLLLHHAGIVGHVAVRVPLRGKQNLVQPCPLPPLGSGHVCK